MVVSSSEFFSDGFFFADKRSFPWSHSTFVHSACLDGAIHVWQTKSNFVRPSMTIEGAHAKGVETGSMIFSVDGRTVLTRGGDDTVKRT